MDWYFDDGTTNWAKRMEMNLGSKKLPLLLAAKS